MCTKFREFYPGDRTLVKDLQKEQTWWLGSIAERSGPKSYVVVLNDGRVWKRHLDHIRRGSMDSAVFKENAETRAQDVAPNPVPKAILPPGLPFSHQTPEGVPAQQPMESRDQVQSENENNSHLPAEKPVLEETPSPDVCPTHLRRSSRVRQTD